jgi:hypothetical protein
MGCKTLHFFSPVQTVLPRELAESLTRATQPGLMSPGGSDQAQQYHSTSLSSESRESLRHVSGFSMKQTVAPRRGDAESVRGRRTRPPLRKIPIKLSLSPPPPSPPLRLLQHAHIVFDNIVNVVHVVVMSVLTHTGSSG